MKRQELVDKISNEIGYGLFDCLFQKHALEKHNYIVPMIQMQEDLFLWIGDSRIAGGNWNLLNIANEMKIDNKAIGGTRAREWSKRACIQQIIQMYPKYLFIGVGGNDVGSGQSFQSIIGDLQKIIFAVKKYCPLTEIFFHCCLPVLVHGKATNKEVREFNRQLEILCRFNVVYFIDFFNNFNCVLKQMIQIRNGTIILDDAMSTEYLNMDEIPWYARSKDRLPVHLNGEGYKLWYDLLNKYFGKKLYE